ncbi:MAG: hypothetical protein ACI96M_000794 [Candidatus Azotimanducaceae bacterium]|jgi:hypothetical protein
MQAFADEGVRVYALSYDEPEPLVDFQSAQSITYKFLSDPDSAVIRDFGILNTIIPEDDHPWFGIPYPGTYILDSSGTITHKFFENNLAVRVGPEQLLRAVRGEVLQEQLSSTEEESLDQASASVYLDGESLAISVQRELVARFVVPKGRHIYASPAPEGSVAVTIELDPNPGLVLRDLIRPVSEAHTLSSTAETFNVYHDLVELRLPITVNGALTFDSGVWEVTLAGTLRWQTCDDDVCDIPTSQRFELTIPVEGAVLPQIRVPEGSPVSEPRAAEHFKQMVQRRNK